MTTHQVDDNRRTIVRVLAIETMRGLRDLAEIHGGDMIRALVFTAVTSGNTQHLTAASGRYAGFYDLPPDRERRPMPLKDIVHGLAIPQDIIERYLDEMVAEGVCEKGPSGYVVPSAVFKRPEMLQGLNEFYTGTVRLVSALQHAGFRVGEPA